VKVYAGLANWVEPFEKVRELSWELFSRKEGRELTDNLWPRFVDRVVCGPGFSGKILSYARSKEARGEGRRRARTLGERQEAYTSKSPAAGRE